MSIKRTEYQDLLNELISIIENTKKQVVSYANSSLTVMFWNVGNRILSHNLKYKRAEYGKQIVVTLSRHLSWSHFITLIPLKEQNSRDFMENLLTKIYSASENSENKLKRKFMRELRMPTFNL